MRIILNADDFGFSEDTVQATIECFEQGWITSATVMPHMPATAAAVAWARAHPERSIGAHLTFGGNSDERCVADPRRIPDLVDAAGRFHPTEVITRRAFLGRVSVDQIAIETEAQIDKLVGSGVRLSHVDSHGNVHKFAAFVEALRRVLPRFGIRRVRRGQNVWLRRPYRSPTFWVRGAWHPRIARDFVTTDGFFIPICDTDRTTMAAAVDRAPGAVLEIGVHPGHSETWREQELSASRACSTAWRAAGHALIGWSDL